jgi:hypothetical protein
MTGKSDYFRGEGYYDRMVNIPAEWNGQRLFVRILGANTVTNMFVNGRHVGEHRGGNSAFTFEVTEYIKYGQSNSLRIVVNNSPRMDVLPTAGMANCYGGLYRGVELYVTDSFIISPLVDGSEGVWVEQHNVSEQRAEGVVRVALNGITSLPKESNVSMVISDADGNRITDKVVNIHKETFLPYIEKTGVKSYCELKSWLASRIDFFHEKGCRLSDHGLDFIPYAVGDAGAIFDKALKGEALTKDEIDAYMTDLLVFFGKEYASRGWCMQIHVGAIRNNNTKMYKLLGPDTGYDSIAETSLGENLARLMDTLEMTNELPRTILYSLNPKDNYVLGTLMGCFQGSGIGSKIQLGSGWWFNDQKDGMEEQLKALGNLGVLGCFVGMLTDSRSFVSYTRHDYFRRILCNLIGTWVENGEYPNNKEMLEKIIRGISYENANEYFGF